MTVYVLVGEVEYEGSEVLGVYGSRDQALAARDEYAARVEADAEGSMTEYDRYSVYPCVMGAVASAVLHREVI